MTETYGHHTSDQEDHQTSHQEAVPEDPVGHAQRILDENQEQADARPDLAAALLKLSQKQEKLELQLGSLMAKRVSQVVGPKPGGYPDPPHHKISLFPVSDNGSKSLFVGQEKAPQAFPSSSHS